MIMTFDQRLRITIGEMFIQNIALSAENEQCKAQLAEKAVAEDKAHEARPAE